MACPRTTASLLAHVHTLPTPAQPRHHFYATLKAKQSWTCALNYQGTDVLLHVQPNQPAVEHQVRVCVVLFKNQQNIGPGYHREVTREVHPRILHVTTCPEQNPVQLDV